MLLGSAYRAGNVRNVHTVSRLFGSLNTSVHKASLACVGTPTASPEHPHTSVMLQEILDGFRGCHIETFVDCTLGAGGHSAAVLTEHPELRTLAGFDQDPDALSIASSRLQHVQQQQQRHVDIHLINANYSALAARLGELQLADGRVNGIVMDLGVSSMQIDQAERGFSFQQDGPLDMRMNPAGATSAEEVLNTWSEAELGSIIKEYGEEKMWKAVARRIVAAREEQPIRTTHQLVKAIGYTRISKDKRGGGKQIHPATRTFQAIRIAVNDELVQLEQAIPQAIQCLAPGGRLGVISFHGLEDRIVKRAFLKAAGKAQNTDEGPISFYSQPLPAAEQPLPDVKLLHKKPLLPSDAEVQGNTRSRSAKLRFVEKL